MCYCVGIMYSFNPLSRRTFLALSAAAPLLAAKKRPVGLELFSVRNELQKDLEGTLKAVAQAGYDGVEFFSPYYSWTPAKAKEVRKQLDDLKMVCLSTHNGANAFAPENYEKSIELNSILGSKFIVLASAGKVEGLDGWKKVAEKLTAGAAKFKSAKIGAGYHNHQLEFKPIEGTRPVEVLAKNTTKDVMMQLDVGTCIEAGSDPVEWINQNPGRIRSLHCKEWSPDKEVGYKALFGEGVAKWKDIFKAAEKTGGVEYYLVEQEGSRFTPFETMQKCLVSFKKTHG